MWVKLQLCLHLFGILFPEGGRISSGKFLVWLVVSVR